MELLGLIYIMKLKHADEFGKTAGSCWRLIFLHSVMPWQQKYRIQYDPSLTKISTNRGNGVVQEMPMFREIRRSNLSDSPSKNPCESLDLDYVKTLEETIAGLWKDINDMNFVSIRSEI